VNTLLLDPHLCMASAVYSDSFEALWAFVCYGLKPDKLSYTTDKTHDNYGENESLLKVKKNKYSFVQVYCMWSICFSSTSVSPWLFVCLQITVPKLWDLLGPNMVWQMYT